MQTTDVAHGVANGVDVCQKTCQLEPKHAAHLLAKAKLIVSLNYCLAFLKWG